MNASKIYDTARRRLLEAAAILAQRHDLEAADRLLTDAVSEVFGSDERPREIVLAHGGRIGVRNRPQQGSEFYFLLAGVEEEIPA